MFSFYTDYPILDKLFDLCPIMQTVMPHENHNDAFLTRAQSLDIINLEIAVAQNITDSCDILRYSDTTGKNQQKTFMDI